IARFNQACAQTTGYSFDEVKGRHSWDVLTIPESVETVKSFFRRLQDGDLEGYRLPNEAEQYVLTKDGDRRLIAWSYTGLPNSEGMIEYIISTGIDITEQSKMAKALRESEEKLRAQYKGIPIPTYTWQREGNDFVLVDCNDAAFEITQGLVVNLIGITASELHQDTPEVQEDLARCYTEMTPIEREMSYEFKTTGETRQLAVKYAFVPPDLVLVHIEDITERKQAQMHLIQADKMASMAVMAGAITHELHNPLSIISLYAQVLRDRPDDPQVYVQCAQKIHEMTQRASKIIDNLVRFARPENDLMMETDLNAILEETLPLVTHLMSSQQVVLHQKLDPDLPSVFGNPALLQQVFTNLILNACNAMPDGGALTIHSRRASEGEVQVSFTDTGRGIPPEDLPKIFDPFFTTMPMGRGTGLGLSVSYSILQMHQGAINVESDVGRGATVSVRLPAMDGLKANREKNNA
ncbi:MAG: ATP-binding protein, partial [Anaerolineae bacterium]